MAVHQRSLGSIVLQIKASSYLSIKPQSQTVVEHPRPPILPQSNSNFPSTSFALTSTMDGNVVRYNVNYEPQGTDTPKITLVPVSLRCYKRHVGADSPFYRFLHSPSTHISYSNSTKIKQTSWLMNGPPISGARLCPLMEKSCSSSAPMAQPITFTTKRT